MNFRSGLGGGCSTEVSWWVLDLPAATKLRVVVRDSDAHPSAAPALDHAAAVAIGGRFI